MREMNFEQEISALRNHQLQIPFVLVFDLTSLQDAGENNHYPELSGWKYSIGSVFRSSAKEHDRNSPLLKVKSLEQLLKMSEFFFITFINFIYQLSVIEHLKVLSLLHLAVVLDIKIIK